MSLRGCASSVVNMNDQDITNMFDALGDSRSQQAAKAAVDSAIAKLITERKEYVDLVKRQHPDARLWMQEGMAADGAQFSLPPSQPAANTPPTTPPTAPVDTSGMTPSQRMKQAFREETLRDKFVRRVVDRMNRFGNFQKALLEAGGKVGTERDVVGAETRMHGRAYTKLTHFRDHVLEPIIQGMAKAKVSMADVGEYLKLAHAKERNAHIRGIDPTRDMGSGIPDTDIVLEDGTQVRGVDTRMAELQAKPNFAEIKKYADKLQAITKMKLDVLVKAGVISEAQRATYESTYQYYVPLKQDEDVQGTGQGLNASPGERRATGRYTEADSPIEHIIRDYERAVLTSEKNTVGQFLLKLIADNQQWLGRLVTIDKPDQSQVIVESKKYDVYINGIYDQTRDSLESARYYKKKLMDDFGYDKDEVTLQPVVHTRIQMRTPPLPTEDEAVVYVKGQKVRLQFRDGKDNILARQWRNLGSEQLGSVLRAGRWINNTLSKLYTGYNPEFIFVNLWRDATSGMINLNSDYGPKVAAAAAKQYHKAFAEAFYFNMHRGLARDSDWGRNIKEYVDAGGSTGAAWVSDIDRYSNDIQATYDDALSLKDVIDSRGAGAAAASFTRRFGGSALKWIEHMNAAGENAFRLATFVSVRDALMSQGKSRQDAVAAAASAAKNVTVNFNKKGELGPQLSAIYLFINPSIQGTARLYQTLSNKENRATTMAMFGALALLGMTSRLSFGDDDDEWERAQQYLKDRNIVWAYTGDDGETKYFSIPLPYGHGWFANLGTALAEKMYGDKPGQDIALQLAQGFIDNFSPVGNPLSDKGELDKSVVNIAPTVAAMTLRPLVNVSGMGSEMFPESAYNPNLPDNEKVFRTTKGSVYDNLSQGLSANFGKQYANDWADVSPEVLKYWTQTLTGGAGKFVMDTVSGLNMAAQGVEMDRREIPGYRKLFGEIDVRGARTQFYTKAAKAEAAMAELKAAVDARDVEAAKSIQAYNAELLGMARVADNFKDAIREQRKLQDEVKRSDMPLAQKRLQLKELERAEIKLYDKFMEVWRARMKPED